MKISNDPGLSLHSPDRRGLAGENILKSQQVLDLREYLLSELVSLKPFGFLRPPANGSLFVIDTTYLLR